MFYKRPSLRRGGMPTGIDTLSPRVQAQSGFFGQTPLFFRDSKQIGLDFPSTMTSMQMPTAFQERVMMKSFPMNASEMGVASVVKPTKETVSITEDIGSNVLDSDFDTTERVDGKIVIKPNKGFLGYEEGIDTTTKEFIKGLTKPGQSEGYIEAKKIAEGNLQKNKDSGFLPNAGPKPVNFDKIAEDVVTNKKIDDDTPKELTFDDIYQTEYNRLEKLIGGREDEKGMLAIALSDAIGTEGTIADKAAALNKSLLKIVGERKANRRDIAKLAYSATKEIEKAKIAAGKVSDSQKNFNRAEKLIGIINNKNSSEADIAAAKKELKNLKEAVDIFGKKSEGSLTGVSSGGELINNLSKLAKRIKKQEKGSDKYNELLSEYMASRNFLLGFNNPGLNNGVATTDAIIGLETKKDGGRIGYAMGTPEPTSKDMSNVPAEPVEQNLSFEELRSRLPKEITDDIVRLISDSSQALQDFAYIRTQGDVNKFNMKYGVNLVLPAQA